MTSLSEKTLTTPHNIHGLVYHIRHVHCCYCGPCLGTEEGQDPSATAQVQHLFPLQHLRVSKDCITISLGSHSILLKMCD